MSEALPHPLRAAGFMLASTLCFGVMAIAIRLASHSLNTLEIAFFRNLFGLLTVLPLVMRVDPASLRTRQLPRYFVRCVIGIFSMLCGFWAIGHLPLAQAMGFDLIWFCTIMLIALEIGFTTPPFGMLLFVMMGVVPGTTLGQVSKAALPYIACQILVVALLIAVPGLVLFLPRMLQ